MLHLPLGLLVDSQCWQNSAWKRLNQRQLIALGIALPLNRDYGCWNVARLSAHPSSVCTAYFECLQITGPTRRDGTRGLRQIYLSDYGPESSSSPSASARRSLSICAPMSFAPREIIKKPRLKHKNEGKLVSMRYRRCFFKHDTDSIFIINGEIEICTEFFLFLSLWGKLHFYFI